MKRFMSLLLSTTLILSAAFTVSADELIVEENQVIAEESVIAEDDIAIEDSEAIVIADDVVAQDEAISFYADDVTGGYELSVSAATGVFPAGTTVAIAKASDEKEAEIAALVADTLAENEEIVKTATFDFEFTTPAGEVVEPSNGAVTVSVNKNEELSKAIEEVADAQVRVYHVTDANALEEVEQFAAAEVAENGLCFEAAQFSSYTLVVINPNKPDTKKPEIKTATQNTKTIDVNDRDNCTFEVIIGATDDYSGFGTYCGGIGFRCESTGDSFYMSLQAGEYKYDEEYGYMYVPYEDGKIHAVEELNSTLEPGVYTVNYADINDKAGNSQTYRREIYDKTVQKPLPKCLKNLKLTIKRGAADIKPSVNSLEIKPASLVITDKSKTVTMKLKAKNSVGKIARVRIYMDTKTTYKNSNTTYTGKTVFELSPTKTANVFSEKFQFGPGGSEYTIRYTVNRIQFVSETGKAVSIVAKKLPASVRSKKLTIERKGAKASLTNFPKIVEAKFSESNITMDLMDYDGSAQINYEIKVKPGKYPVDYCYISIRDSKTGKSYTLYGGKYNLKNNVFSGTFSVSKYAGNGTFTVDYAYIYDVNHNETYYNSNSKSTYISGNTAYTPITKQLKKLKMTIKNTYK